jgi:putative iron-regulated protein
MQRNKRIWFGLGAAVLGSTATVPADAAALSRPAAALPFPGIQLAQEEGEGGEGGEGEGGEGGAVTVADYRLRSTHPNAFRYDASLQVATYGRLVRETYAAARDDARSLQAAVTALLANPTDTVFAAARQAWINARPAYLQAEAFRFYGGPIDGGIERRVNAWPVAGAHLDALINTAAGELDLGTLVGRHLAGGDANVTTGWHAIEFLLWGEGAAGSQARRPADYVGGAPNNDRRRNALRLAADLLVSDLDALLLAWEPDRDNFRSSLGAMDQRNAIGHIFHGIVVLAGYELAAKRLGAALQGSADSAQSRFSDSTYADLMFAVRGIRNVYFGSARGAEGAGFDALLAALDADLNHRVVARLNRAESAIAALDIPFERIPASPPGSRARAEAEAAVVALQELADVLQAAGNRLGVLVMTLPKG